MNPLMQKMGGASPAMGGISPQMVQQVKQAMNALRSVANPQQAIMQAAQQSPQLNAVMQMVGNRNPQEVFIEQCKQHGVNPDDAMQQIKQILA